MAVLSARDNDWQFSVIPADVGAELAPTQSGNRNGRILPILHGENGGDNNRFHPRR